MKTILVTGGSGFIGSNFIRMILNKYDNYKVINIDSLTYAGNLENLSDCQENENYSFYKIDITDRSRINAIFEENTVDYVVNFAAESHVDRSIEDPEIFLKTNIMGTQVLLDACKSAWNLDPTNKYSKEYKPGVKYLQVSTDEVYGSLGKEGLFTETTSINPNSPYSASKASADMFVRAYHETYSLPINITRCSNNYGPYQFPEKLIPLMISNCMKDKELPVYGDGLQIRDWLHVSDHCEAIDVVLHKGLTGEVYNIGGNNEKANVDIVKLIIESLGKSEKLIKYVQDRPGHDRRYAIDNSKISADLGWKPKFTFEEGMQITIDWYLNNMDWVTRIVSGEYETYYSKMYSKA